MSYQNELLQMADFYKTNSRGYHSALGLPETNPGLGKIIDALRSHLSYLSEIDYTIFELGPQGGRWTYQVLSILGNFGLPRSLNYTLFGQAVEHALVLRDVLQQPECGGKDFTYSKTARVRTRKVFSSTQTRMITELQFNKIPLTLNKPESPLTTHNCDLLLCMSNLQHLSDSEVRSLLLYMDYLLAPGGMILLDIQTERLSILTSTTGLPSYHITVCETAAVNGFTYLVGRKLQGHS